MFRKKVKKYRRKRQRDRIKAKYLIFFFCTVILAGGFYLGFYRIKRSDYFRVKQISFIGPMDSISNVIVDMMRGKSIFEVEIEGIRKELKDRYPEYRNIWVIKRFPSEIRIEAEKRAPFAQIKDKGYYTLDDEFVILSREFNEPEEGLLVINITGISGPFVKGRQIRDTRLVKSYQLIEALMEGGILNRFSVDSINAGMLTALSFYLNGVNIIVGADNYKPKIDILNELISSQAISDFSSLNYLDLRGEKPHIGYRR